MSKAIKMRLGDDTPQSQEEEHSEVKEFIKDKTIDIAIDKVADIANISMPLSMLETLISMIKMLENSLENIEQIDNTRGR
jgi:predicted metallo-beta-lactamase superfamily hydrolase